MLPFSSLGSGVFTQLFSCYVVALMRIMFPTEARIAMDIAQVDCTLKLTLDSGAKPPPEKELATIDLNETPFHMNEEHLARMSTLSKTGETQIAFV